MKKKATQKLTVLERNPKQYFNLNYAKAFKNMSYFCFRLELVLTYTY